MAGPNHYAPTDAIVRDDNVSDGRKSIFAPPAPSNRSQWSMSGSKI